MTEVALKHDVSVCIDSETLPWEPFAPRGLPAGVEARYLRRLDDGSPRSILARAPAGWRIDTPVTCSADLEGYVIQGALVGEEARCDTGVYFFHPEGSRIDPWTADDGTILLLIFGGNPMFTTVTMEAPVSDDAIPWLDTATAPWIESIVNGTPTGIKRTVLRVDPVTGADTRLLVVPPGFEGRGPNWHPVNEEIFCLSGDIGPDDRRLMKPGTYLHNPAYGVHGYHEHSKGGATVLEWHDGQWVINFVDPASPLAKPRS